MGKTFGSSGSASYHQSRPSPGEGISSTAPGTSFSFTEGEGSGEETLALIPKVDSRPVGL